MMSMFESDGLVLGGTTMSAADISVGTNIQRSGFKDHLMFGVGQILLSIISKAGPRL